ncbi:MAG: CapA family protein [Nanoarchaeota archaeon]
MEIAIIGDVMLGRLIDNEMKIKIPEYFWGDTLDKIKKANLSLINLECSLTKSNIVSKTLKTFYFKAEPSNAINVLKQANIKAVNIANNHIMDFGEEGLKDTIEILNEAGIKHCGAGINIAEAKKPILIEINKLKIGIIGMTDNMPEWHANEKPGIFFIDINNDNAENLSNEIKRIKPNLDILILSLHWGQNMALRPKESFMDFAHKLIDAGADIIHGHSSHVFQGIEIYNNKPIFYSCGDFIDDYAVDPALRNDFSFFSIIELQKKEIKEIKLFPTLIKDFRANLAQSLDYEEIADRIITLSGELGTHIEKGNDFLLVKI